MKKCNLSVKSNLLRDAYKPSEAAKILKISKKTVLTKCETGEIQAIPQLYGNSGRVTYLIPRTALEFYQQQQKQRKQPLMTEAVVALGKHKSYLNLFKEKLANGTHTGKEFSDDTINFYGWHLERFFEAHDLLTADTLEAFFHKDGKLRKSFAQKEKCHRAAVCYAKFLVKRKLLSEDELRLIKELKPVDKRRAIKRHDLTEEELDALQEFAKAQSALNHAIFCLFKSTGLRASEVCNIELADVDLEKQELGVVTKGSEYRTVGFPRFTLEAIQAWLEKRRKFPLEAQKQPWLFLGRGGKQLRRDGVRCRMVKLGNALNKKLNEQEPGSGNIHATPHAIRRSFVTISLNKGRPIHQVQGAVGHKRIQTTMVYNRTRQQQVVDAMKNWG